MTKKEQDRQRAMDLLAEAKRQLARCSYDSLEGIVMVEHYYGSVMMARAMAKCGRTSLEACERLAKEVEEALLLYDVSRYVKCQDDPSYRHLLEFYRLDNGRD